MIVERSTPEETPATEVAPLAAERADGVQLATLSAGHAVVDSYGHTLLAPIFPVLATQLGLGLDEVGGLPIMMGLSASLAQPLLGIVTDRWPRIPAVALGPAVAAIFVGLVGFAQTYLALASLLFLAGLGIGAYHPQAASLASVAARGRGFAMSAFTVGGNIGFGVAPLLGALYFKWFGLDRFYLASVPGLTFAALLLYVARQRTDAHQTLAPPRARSPRPGSRLALTLLTGTVAVRAAVQISVSTFLAFLLRQRLVGGQLDETTIAGISLSVFLLANALSGPIGGHLCDRVGRKSVMLASLAAAPVAFAIALRLPGLWTVAGLAIGGFLLMLPHPANVVMAQQYMPASSGLAASMITGLAWGVGQLLCWPVGAFAEHSGVEAALRLVAWLPLAGILLVLPLEEPDEPGQS